MPDYNIEDLDAVIRETRVTAGTPQAAMLGATVWIDQHPDLSVDHIEIIYDGEYGIWYAEIYHIDWKEKPCP